MLTKQDVAFRHYREIDADGTVNPRGGVTIVFPKRTAEAFGMSFCSKDDNFEYEFGRRLALERLNEFLEHNKPSTVHYTVADALRDADRWVSYVHKYRHITRSKNRRNKHEA